MSEKGTGHVSRKVTAAEVVRDVVFLCAVKQMRFITRYKPLCDSVWFSNCNLKLSTVNPCGPGKLG